MYKLDEIIKCEVTGVNSYGIFVKCDSEYNGLIHISEISDGFVKDVNTYVQVGDIISCRIIEIDEESKHLKLSIKHIDYKKDGKATGIIESRRGFKPLKERLPIWTAEKIEEYESEKKTSQED